MTWCNRIRRFYLTGLVTVFFHPSVKPVFNIYTPSLSFMLWRWTRSNGKRGFIHNIARMSWLPVLLSNFTYVKNIKYVKVIMKEEYSNLYKMNKARVCLPPKSHHFDFLRSKISEIDRSLLLRGVWEHLRILSQNENIFCFRGGKNH